MEKPSDRRKIDGACCVFNRVLKETSKGAISFVIQAWVHFEATMAMVDHIWVERNI